MLPELTFLQGFPILGPLYGHTVVSLGLQNGLEVPSGVLLQSLALKLPDKVWRFSMRLNPVDFAVLGLKFGLELSYGLEALFTLGVLGGSVQLGLALGIDLSEKTCLC